jgi:hypothetical protein
LSRNKDRVGGAHTTNVDAPPPPVAGEAAGGFTFVVPTEFVELPSEGKFYPEGHPLCGHDSIEIRQMTAKEEDILTSRTLLKKGVALDRVLQNLITDKRIKADSLLVGDRNAIIIATRISGYGNEYNTSVTCPSCGESQRYIFDLNDVNIYRGEDRHELDIVNNEDGTFKVKLPKTRVEVDFKLLTGNDEKGILSSMHSEKKRKTYEKNVTRQLYNIVTAVNGDDSLPAKQYLVDNIPSMDSRHLRLAYRLSTPNIDLTQNFECSECDYEQDMEVPLTADFFWPDR